MKHDFPLFEKYFFLLSYQQQKVYNAEIKKSKLQRGKRYGIIIIIT